MEVYGDPIIMYPKPYSINLRGTIILAGQLLVSVNRGGGISTPKCYDAFFF